VLEHLRYPAETLLNIKKQLLKPDGLLIIDVPNEFNDFQTVGNAAFNLNEWWVCVPNHINYFSVSSISHLLDICGYDVKYCEASFPLEIFLLMGDVYVGDSELGNKCHQKRIQFEYLMKKHGKTEKLSLFYQALAELNLGRQVIVYASPRL
jgi:predicted SAM-dependent methyltransferase